MSVFDIFNTAPAQQAPAQQQQAPAPNPGGAAPPGQIPAPTTVPQTTPNTAPNGTVPNQPAVPEVPADNSPLAPFKELWEAPVTDPKAPAPAPTTPQQLNLEDVQKAVAKATFTNAITPEHLAAIGEGGEAAQKAFAESLNAVAQQVLTQSVMVNSKLSEQNMNTFQDAQSSKLQDLVQKHALSESVNSSNPIFKNPAVQPVIEATKQQLLTKFPNATTAEHAKMLEDYMLAMGAAFTPAPEVDPTKVTQGEDWEKFLTM